MGREGQLRHGAASFGRILSWRPPKTLAILGRRKVRKATSLNWPTRVVLGLLHMGFSSQASLGKALGVEEPWILAALPEFAKMLLASEDELIQDCIAEGLPIMASAELPFPNTVRCPGCGLLVNVVSCVSCRNEMFPEDVAERDDFDNWKPVPAEEPTEARPGTVEKIEIMRARIEQGQSPFHPDDAERLGFDKLAVPVAERLPWRQA